MKLKKEGVEAWPLDAQATCRCREFCAISVDEITLSRPILKLIRAPGVAAFGTAHDTILCLTWRTSVARRRHIVRTDVH